MYTQSGRGGGGVINQREKSTEFERFIINLEKLRLNISTNGFKSHTDEMQRSNIRL